MKKNLTLIAIVVILMISAFVFNSTGEYGGSDDAAETLITELRPDYEPWFEPIYEPKSGEIESLLFTLQGSIGVGIIAYAIGYYKGKGKEKNVDH
ncbi:energy-coupling factor ABC transporter substrate-binding protein [Vagococcus intermedius]|uniref:Cobalt transport protein CbiN n=1 Tax=Vagococcus intermedius TaxID=2991418 RepID=A0AAF0CTT9_9ENTE|nr:energy-coupling factor ABC transporter substrate-binding protein [Vagococcus intermedius]WEG72731.1 energy-coupling factor ABC transporter substrate-binding protein [Vagococcus intermedius]WEG74817.1 energy-coupling factor ABC transporter substrate-binding protein [Vagococcus intermedius]